MYKNNYRDLAGYLANYCKLPNGNYMLDGMPVTKISDDCISLDLRDAKYEIGLDDDDYYGYAHIKVISPNSNAYIFTGYGSYGDWNGYYTPTENGLMINCEYNGRKKFIMNTSAKPCLYPNESVMLSEIFFNKYLKQSHTEWTYKYIKFSGNGKGGYTISVPSFLSVLGTDAMKTYDKSANEISTNGNINDYYYENGSGTDGSFQAFTTDSGKYQYYWRRTDGDSIAIDEYSNITVTDGNKTIKITTY
jgi:hypothetical protein